MDPEQGTQGIRGLLVPAADTSLPRPPLLARIRESVIGDDTVMPGPFGPRRVTYADYTASGRALTFLEDAIRDHVLPLYANTHTESSGTGRQTTRLREDARSIISTAVNGDESTCVIFTGSGSTAAVDKLLGILNLRIPADLDAQHDLSAHIPVASRPVVFVGPFEHHSNELPWRESICDVVRIPEDSDGHIDIDALTSALVTYADRPLRIGSFSAASNVTGIISDTHRISSVLHEHGALAFWDFAAAGPYVDIEMNPRCTEHPSAYKDAIFLSPHKFIGGPGTPGVLIVRRELLKNSVPDVVGGGTVAYVNAHEHRYLEDPVHREEGGTPAIVESIRAGLVFQLKEAVGSETIHLHEADLLRRALHVWNQIPSMQVLGNPEAERLSIVSFVIRRPGGRYLHHNFVVAVLNDLFGIQSRGGCSCAGPYGHRLLDIDDAHSHEYEQEIVGGCEGIKPGWVRVNLNYFISEAVFEHIVMAVAWTALHGHRLLDEYRFDPLTGLWQHRSGVTQTLIRLTDLSYDEDGRLDTSHIDRRERADESVLAGYLDHADRILAGLHDAEEHSEADIIAALADRVGPNFEHLRWFDLTPASLR
jgi:selenocysteine lyase/cysteine desulfurase